MSRCVENMGINRNWGKCMIMRAVEWREMMRESDDRVSGRLRCLGVGCCVLAAFLWPLWSGEAVRVPHEWPALRLSESFMALKALKARLFTWSVGSDQAEELRKEERRQKKGGVWEERDEAGEKRNKEYEGRGEKLGIVKKSGFERTGNEWSEYIGIIKRRERNKKREAKKQ